MAEQSERDKKIQELNALVDRLRAEYADDPNVVTIGWGSPRRGTEYQDEVAILFFVTSKDESPRGIEAMGSRPIESSIEGYPTDVVEYRPKPSSAGNRDETTYDPLLGGPATSNAEEHIFWFNGGGTLGILCRDASDGTAMALSNWHVWADGGDQGDTIIQPAHPRAGDHIEGITKVLACGPIITSLLEGRAPSPLALGLYGGAAAAAAAAALSDYRDPIRRGQDATPTDPGELTEYEEVEVAIEYPDLPWPGRPFRTNAKWEYRRHTDRRVLTENVSESPRNTQFLLGYLVVTDRPEYEPGDRVNLIAAIWDYQLRPCDAYYVVAHMIPRNNPDEVVRVVLHPTTCPRTIPIDPPDDGDGTQTACIDFGELQPGATFPYKHRFRWLGVLNPGQTDLRIVDWSPSPPDGRGELRIESSGLVFTHPPATRVTVEVVQFTNQPIHLIGFDHAGNQVASAVTPPVQGTVHTLQIQGNAISRTRVRGGGGEGLVLKYCIDVNNSEEIELEPSEELAEALVAAHVIDPTHLRRPLRARRCCFGGWTTLPPSELPGKWDVYLVVQNVNHVPDGTPPEQAAVIIGGHILSTEVSVEGCAAVMLADHAFDII